MQRTQTASVFILRSENPQQQEYLQGLAEITRRRQDRRAVVGRRIDKAAAVIAAAVIVTALIFGALEYAAAISDHWAEFHLIHAV